MEKITEQATSYINGNISETKQALKEYSKIELINFIQEYSLLSGFDLAHSLEKVKILL